MNKRHRIRLNMAQTTLGVVQAPEYVGVLEAAPVAWKKGIQRADELVDAIMATSQEIDGAKGMASASKIAALNQLGERALVIGSALHSMAFEHHLVDLEAATDMNRSVLSYGPAAAILHRCSDIHQWATEHLEALRDYSVTEADLEALKAAIDAYQDIHTKPRRTRAGSRAASQTLDLLFRELMGVFTERLDKIAVRFRQTDPKFYQAYKAARIIVNVPGVRSAEPKEEPTPAPATAAAA